MTDPGSALLQYLRHAADCYGADLALPVTTPPVRRPEPAIGTAPDPRGAPATPATAEPATPGPADPDAALAALRADVMPCTKCKLADNRTHLVFGEGSASARVMFVGEAPGQVEDETGRPFVGRSGQLLDKIIENAMGMRRTDVFIANVNKCRPPGNRDPQPAEIAACLPWLRAQIEIIQPEVIITLGRVALSNLLGTSEPMRRMRGRELLYQGIPVVATWHPAYLLRNPAAKAETWDDIKRANRTLGNPAVPGGEA